MGEEEFNRMKQYQQAIRLLRNAISKDVDEFRLESIDWTSMMPLLGRSGISSIAYQGIMQLPDEKRPDSEMLQKWHQNVVHGVVMMTMANKALYQVVERAEEEKIPIVCFKGIVLASLYPEMAMRYSCDSDILIDAADMDRMSRCLLDLGYEQRKQKEHVNVFSKGTHHTIELHTSLWEDFGGKTIDFLNEMQIDSVSNRIFVDIQGQRIPTLPITNHLIYLLYHFVKHLATEGVNMKFLLDIILFLNRYYEEIDFDLLKERTKKLHYDTFLAVIMQIGLKYLNLCGEVVEKYNEAKEIKFFSELDEFNMLDALLCDDKHDVEKWNTLYLMIPFFCNQQEFSSVGKMRKQMKYSMYKSMIKKSMDFMRTGLLHDPFGDSEFDWQAQGERPVSFNNRWEICRRFCDNTNKKMEKRVASAIDRIILLKKLGIVVSC